MRHGSTVWRTALRIFPLAHNPLRRVFFYPLAVTGTSGLKKSVWRLEAFKTCPDRLFTLTLAAATSAPQQAAGYAMSCALAVVPYVLARAMQGMTKNRIELAADRIVAAIEKPKS